MSTSMPLQPLSIHSFGQLPTSTATATIVSLGGLSGQKGFSQALVKPEPQLATETDGVCSSLQALPTLIKQLQHGPASGAAASADSSTSDSPSPRRESDSKTGILHLNLDHTGSTLHDDSDVALNASAGSDAAIEMGDMGDGDPSSMAPNETLANLVSALFPSTSLPNGPHDFDPKQSRRSLGSVIERLHSNGTSPVPDSGKRKAHSDWGSPVEGKSYRQETPKKDLLGDFDDEERRKRNAEWTYKGDWTCKKCGSLVNPKHRTAQKLLRHMVSHGPRAWSCSGCNSKFGLHTSFVSHNKSVHNGEATPVSLRTSELEDIWFQLAHECFPDFVDQVHSCIKKTTHV
ncbi:unnamed protein product, partial [Mesorhabditis spiculigera]